MKLFIVASICFIINQQRAVWEWFSRPLLGCLGFQRFLALGELGPKLWAVSPPALRNPWFLPLQSESEKHLLPRELLGLCGEVFISCWNMQTSPCSSFRTLFFFFASSTDSTKRSFPSLSSVASKHPQTPYVQNTHVIWKRQRLKKFLCNYYCGLV